MTWLPAGDVATMRDMSDATVPGELQVGGERPDRNLALELVRVTEAAAMAAG